MALARRTSRDICLHLLRVLNRKGEALRWDLIKLLGNEEAFRRWFDSILIPAGLVDCVEKNVGKRTLRYYKKTKRGEIMHDLLMNNDVIRFLRRILKG